MPGELLSNIVQISDAKGRAAQNSVPSVFRDGLHIAGNLVSEGDLIVDGRVEGDVRGRNVTVGATGTIIGNIVADEATIGGAVEGDVMARSVVLTCTAKVMSDIIQETLCVAPGAIFEGVCRRPSTLAAAVKAARSDAA
jgi:cytoskeletal protein CcmA (bactofilin family)